MAAHFTGCATACDVRAGHPARIAGAFLLPLAQTNLYSHGLPWSALLAIGAGRWRGRGCTIDSVLRGVRDRASHVALGH